VCSSLVKRKKKKERMLNKASTNEDGQQHVVIGDILLHSGSKITLIQVVIHSLSTAPSLTLEKPNIHRLSANSSGTVGSQTLVPCDLKNAPSVKITPERTKPSSSSKKLLRMQKAGMALVKELKSKVATPNHTTNANTDDEGTQF